MHQHFQVDQSSVGDLWVPVSLKVSAALFLSTPNQPPSFLIAAITSSGVGTPKEIRRPSLRSPLRARNFLLLSGNLLAKIEISGPRFPGHLRV